MTHRRVGAVVLLVTGVAAAVPTAGAVVGAGSSSAGAAGSAASSGSEMVVPDGRLEGLDFDGLVQFSWVDRSGAHSARLPVQGTNGVVHIGGRGGPQGAEWPADVGPLPSLAGKYHTTETNGPIIAGRPTTLLQISSGAGSTETLALDQATGLVLSRAELDDHGSVVRSMVFDDLSLRLTHAPGTPVGSSTGPTTRAAPARLPAVYSAPSRLAGGYQQIQAEPASDGLRVVYSDGVHGLSIFEQPGHLSASTRSYSWAGGEVVTWQSGPTVFTAVGDGPSADVRNAARSVPQPHQLSLLGHLRSLSREVVDTLSGSQ